ncbi:hypothetical protein VDF98_03380 [Xanthomonas campestris pv. raphani]|uniref:hypothetical protein n=1 Tax=Pseudomonadota TaxID=1224 RepID=UPI002368CBC1|nr:MULTISPECIES: hypothetical protein [Pseudomonadota]MEA9822421.1 hypothetical protein [Xanthomonas campestris pv. raphani]MEA9850846.1 hypothetical protein [Xanthomonas campestris pv. raphani]MEA9855019.1 hypothetical protein [Xanthomonas campestris pv. raphani]MEA9963864.1 hypothetical protein [Xanthomonas campestris pv. raphani]WDJ24302.1 hypothetical protein JH270_10620 [Xanthomonas campestris pv. raphani]
MMRSNFGHGLRRFGADGLAALVLGLLTTPFAYVATGVLGDFSWQFSLLFVPPLLAGVAFLAHELLSRGSGAKPSSLQRVLAVAAWGFVLCFVTIVSGARLQQGWERVGGLCVLWLVCSVLAFPAVVFGGRDARLSLVARGWCHSGWVFVLLAGGIVGLAVYSLVLPARFP